MEIEKEHARKIHQGTLYIEHSLGVVLWFEVTFLPPCFDEHITIVFAMLQGVLEFLVLFRLFTIPLPCFALVSQGSC